MYVTVEFQRERFEAATLVCRGQACHILEEGLNTNGKVRAEFSCTAYSAWFQDTMSR